MEDDGLWLGAGLGIALGVTYVAASLMSNQRALRSQDRVMHIVIGSMVLRLTVASAALVAILLLLPVAPSAFLGSFFVMFLVGLVVEVWLFHTREAPPR